MRKIVLASASPRRRELLSQVGITFEVKPASGEERITSTEPSKVVEELSFQKAMFTAHALEKEQADDLADILIIGADTIVSYALATREPLHNQPVSGPTTSLSCDSGDNNNKT